MFAKITSLCDLESYIDEYKVFSFDIFDTLVFHRVEDHCRRDNDICLLQANYLNKIGIKCEFWELKQYRDIEFTKSKLVTKDEVDYFSAYTNVLSTLNVEKTTSLDIVNHLLEIESCYEASIAFPNPEAIKILKKLKSSQKVCIAVSDMYLPKESIIKILQACGLVNYIDDIFISSETFRSKHSGRIFKYLVDEKRIVPLETIHVGDNLHSDAKMPSLCGIYALHYLNNNNEKRKVQLTKKNKQSLVKFSSSKVKLSSLLAEASYYYVKSVVEYAAHHSISRILLLTRDANNLQRAFCDYVKANKINIDIGVLHLDRINSYYLNMESVADLRKNLWLWGKRGNAITLNDWLNSLGNLDSFFMEKYKVFFDAYGAFPMNICLMNSKLEPIFKELLCCKRSSVTNYLKELGLFSKTDKILVDIGYSGTAFRELSQFIKRNSLSTGRIDCFLMCSNEYLTDNATKIDSPVFLHVPTIMPYQKMSKLATLNFAWLEPFFLDSRLGALNGYCDCKPMRDTYEGVTPWFYSSGLAEHLFSLVSNNIEASNTLDILQSKLNFVVTAPSNFQVKELKNISHTKSFQNNEVGSILIKVSIFSLLQDFKSLIAEDYWIGGSMKISHLGLIAYILGKYFGLIKSVKTFLLR